MAYHEFGYKSCTGQELFACSWEAQEKSTVNILIVHGLGEHCGRYQAVAEFLVAQNYNVYAFDNIGFGRSPGKRGHVSSFDVYLKDIQRFIQIINDPLRHNKSLILGHSMGGLLSLAHGITYPNSVDGYIISSPALKRYPLSRREEVLLDICNRILPRISLKNSLAVDKISHDQKVVKEYREDVLVHNRVTPRFVKELIRVMAYTQKNARQFIDPLLLLYAGEDYLVDPLGVQEFVSTISVETSKEIICYQNMYHEILNEDGKEKVFQTISSWIKNLLNRDEIINI